MYILLCGYPPFHGNNNTEIFEKIKKGKFEFLRKMLLFDVYAKYFIIIKHFKI